jgi:hypothetical protein
MRKCYEILVGKPGRNEQLDVDGGILKSVLEK